MRAEKILNNEGYCPDPANGPGGYTPGSGSPEDPFRNTPILNRVIILADGTEKPQDKYLSADAAIRSLTFWFEVRAALIRAVDFQRISIIQAVHCARAYIALSRWCLATQSYAGVAYLDVSFQVIRMCILSLIMRFVRLALVIHHY